MKVQLRLLGAPRLAIDGRTVIVAWPRRSLSLLTYLCHARGVVSRDAVAFALWPDDDPEAARGNVRRNLNLLRATLPPVAAAWIVVDAGTIAFDRVAANTDVATFEALSSEPASLAAAIDAYGGDYAAPLDDAWVLFERERLRARYHGVLSELASTNFSARRFDAALDYARRVVADEPLREDVVRRTIAIRYAMGDRPGALAEFERFRCALEREMGLEPMPETLALYDSILRGEPLPSAPDAAGAPFAALGVGRERTGQPASALLPFGGRRAPLANLCAQWEAASAGGGRMAFVSGDAGVGKTRVVAEFLERTVGAGARILRGTTASPEARPFEAILTSIAQAAPFVAALDVEPVWLGIVAQLVPEIDPGRAAPASAPLPPERETLRLFEAFARILTRVARARPVVAILEDIHWAGPGTLSAIRHLATRIRGHRLLLIVTYRDDDDGGAARALRREICAFDQACSIALGPLPHDEALGILAGLPQPPGADDARLLVERSEGNPLFLTELLREYPHGLSAVGSGIAGVVCARLARCSPPARDVARVAAMCGSSFDLDLLRYVIGWSDGAILDGIAELLGRHFIRATAHHERGSYAYTHALVREAVADSAAEDERQRTHHIVARALEARSSGASGAVEIALHWQAARQFERAAGAYLTAATASLRTRACDEAASLATAGEALTLDRQVRFDLVRVRIEANLRRVGTELLRADVRSLAQLAESLDETARYDAALLAYRVEETGGDVETRRIYAGALRQFADEAAPRRSAEIADVDAGDALLRGDIGAAIAAAEHARELYARAGATAPALRAAIFVARMRGRLGFFDAARALLATLEASVAALGEAHVTMDYWFARATAPHAQHDAPATLDATDHLRVAAHAAGDRLMEGHACAMAATAHAHACRLTHAFREHDRANAIYASLGAAIAQRRISNNHASLLLQVGRTAEATAILRENLRVATAEESLEQQYFSANNLGIARLAAGAAGEAVELQRFAVACAKMIGSEAFEALALGDLGASESAVGDTAEGVAHLICAASMNQLLQRSGARAHDLARAAFSEPVAPVAGAYAREALAIVNTDLDGVTAAPEILSYCAQTFERCGEPVAAAHARRRGRELLERRAAAIEDERDRTCYRELPPHAALLAPRALPTISSRTAIDDGAASPAPGIAIMRTFKGRQHH